MKEIGQLYVIIGLKSTKLGVSKWLAVSRRALWYTPKSFSCLIWKLNGTYIVYDNVALN